MGDVMQPLNSSVKLTIMVVIAFFSYHGLTGCRVRDSPPRRQVSGGEPAPGRQAFLKYGCGGCHFVPGVDRARGKVAPPLMEFSERAYVAGVVSNTPENLVRWIMAPESISPRTAMPNLGVSEQDARDIAAFLYSLEEGG
jgi:cytochrome c